MTTLTRLLDLCTRWFSRAQHARSGIDGPGADTTPGNPTYQQILAVFAAGQPLRAKDICRALGVGVTANHTESLRAKLKRLVTRGVLTENTPGLFTLAPSTAGPADATVA